MKKRFAVALLAVPFLALPAKADDPFAPGLPWKIDCGADVYFRVLSRQNGWGCALGPWYNYWPLEAYFQVPALPQYPYWPAPQALAPWGTSVTVPTPPCPPAAAIPTPAPAAAVPAPVSAPKAAYFKPVGYAPQGYYPYQQGYYPYQQPAPWWYGR
jgi:hypothetical protein